MNGLLEGARVGARVVGLVCVALLAGCARVQEGEGVETEPPCDATDATCITVQDLCVTFATEECERRAGCGLLEPLQKAACVRRLVDACPGAELAHAVGAGRLAYSPRSARACLSDSLTSLGCRPSPAAYFEGYWESEPLLTRMLEPEPAAAESCAQVFHGQAEAGQPCAQSVECSEGMYCDRAAGNPAPCPGTCTPSGQEGAACGTGMPDCAPELRCYWTSSSTAGCVRRGAEGDSCSCPFHRTDSQCGCLTSLICLSAPLSSSGVCIVPYASAGEHCGVYGPFCHAGTFCSDGTCQPAGGEGASCDGDSQCEVSLACVGSQCVPRAGQGESCAGSRPCKRELYCDASNVCQPLPSEGEACLAYGPNCSAGLTCASATRTCVPATPAAACTP